MSGENFKVQKNTEEQSEPNKEQGESAASRSKRLLKSGLFWMIILCTLILVPNKLANYYTDSIIDKQKIEIKKYINAQSKSIKIINKINNKNMDNYLYFEKNLYKGKDKKIFEICKQMLQKNPRNSVALKYSYHTDYSLNTDEKNRKIRTKIIEKLELRKSLDLLDAYILGYFYYKQKKYEKAEKIITSVQDELFKNKKKYFLELKCKVCTGLARIYTDKKDYVTAEKYIIEANNYISDDVWGIIYWAVILEKIGDNKGALLKYQEIEEKKIANAAIYNYWGLLLEKIGDNDGAIKKFNKAKDFDSQYYSAYVNLANLYDKEGKSKKALEEFNNAELVVNMRKNPRYYKSWGNVLYKVNDFTEAIIKYKKAIELDDTYYWAYGNLGHTLNKQRLYMKALEKFAEGAVKYKKANNKDINDAWFYNEWGRTYLAAKNYDKAIEKFEKAIELDDIYYLAYGNLGNTLKEQGQYMQALEKFTEGAVKYKKTNSKDINDAWYYNSWGNVLYKVNDFTEAIIKYKLSIAIDSSYYWAYGNLGNVLNKQRLYMQALEKFAEGAIKYKKANSKDINDAWYYNAWGNTFYDSNDYDKAIEKYKQSIAIDSSCYWAYGNWGSVQRDRMQYTESTNIFTEGVTKYKEKTTKDIANSWFYNEWGRTYLAAENYDKAIEKFEKAIELDDIYYLAYSNWGNALRVQGQYMQALEKFAEGAIKYKKANSKDINDAWYYNAWGNVFYDSNDYDKAIEKYKQAIAIDSSYYRAYGNWGNALKEQGQYMQALDKFAEGAVKYKKANSKYINNAWYYTAWGNAFDGSNDYDKAIEKYKQAIAIDSSYYWAYGNIALIWYNKENYSKADKWFHKGSNNSKEEVNSWFYTNWAENEIKLGHYSRAIKFCRKALQQDSGYYETYQVWAKALRKQQKF